MVVAQGNLFASGPVGVDSSVAFDRVELDGSSWVEVARGWMGGADEIAGRLLEKVDWRHHRRWMYDRMVDEPRLSRWYRSEDPLPDPALAQFRQAAADHCGVDFGALGLNLYRDGNDSVALHSDRELDHLEETLVVIVTFGATRPFLLKPSRGGRAIDLRPGSGDLIVMGGACQSRWLHGVTKVRRGCGPRISASVRWARQAGPEREWAPPRRWPTDPQCPDPDSG